MLRIATLILALCLAHSSFGQDNSYIEQDSVPGRGIKHQLGVGLANPILGFTTYNSITSGASMVTFNPIPFVEYKKFWGQWALRTSINFNGVIQNDQENLIRVFALVGMERRWTFRHLDVFLGTDLVLPYSSSSDLLSGTSEWQTGVGLAPVAGLDIFFHRYVSLSVELGGGYGVFFSRFKQYGVSNGRVETTPSWVLTRLGGLGIHINI